MDVASQTAPVAVDVMSETFWTVPEVAAAAVSVTAWAVPHTASVVSAVALRRSRSSPRCRGRRGGGRIRCRVSKGLPGLRGGVGDRVHRVGGRIRDERLRGRGGFGQCLVRSPHGVHRVGGRIRDERLRTAAVSVSVSAVARTASVAAAVASDVVSARVCPVCGVVSVTASTASAVASATNPSSPGPRRFRSVSRPFPTRRPSRRRSHPDERLSYGGVGPCLRRCRYRVHRGGGRIRTIPVVSRAARSRSVVSVVPHTASTASAVASATSVSVAAAVSVTAWAATEAASESPGAVSDVACVSSVVPELVPAALSVPVLSDWSEAEAEAWVD